MSIGIGIIGCGEAGLKYAKEAAGLAREDGGVHVRALCDTDLEASCIAEMRDEVLVGHPIRRATYTRYEDLLQDRDVDAVVVTTPHILHVDYALAALRAGKHVLVEKPLATQRQEEEMDALYGALCPPTGDHPNVFMAMPYEGFRDFVCALEFIDEDIIGPISAVEAQFNLNGPHKRWYYTKETAHGGAILDTAVYGISRLCTIMGPVTKVSAITQKLIPWRQCVDDREPRETEVEDDAVLRLDFGTEDTKRALGIVRANWGSPYRCDYQKITGPLGAVFINMQGRYDVVVQSLRDRCDVPRLADGTGLTPLGDGAFMGLRRCYEAQVERDPANADRMRGFVERIRAGKGTPRHVADFAQHVVEVMRRAYDSSADGGAAQEVTSTFDITWRPTWQRARPEGIDTTIDLRDGHVSVDST